MFRLMRVLFLLLLLAAPLGGCKQLRKFMPPTTVDNPAEGSREWIVYKAIEAAQTPDEKAGWDKLRPLLHADVVGNSASENSFRTMNYPTFRRKVAYLTPDDAKATYLLDYDEPEGDDVEFRLFVVNEKSDMPSPFRVRRDPKAGDDWRLANLP
jgi:hypothetical protein